ncbi:keratin-associated protein 10-7 [Bombyx mori]|uniref:Uncharacterized protein n=1 Tax=Bombyx mori TaxID=7091 RepID=A0A8R2AM75_BOMMO|nr:keratin-associated protein 10-7 isoform X3 [Bombyx mori]
MACCCKPGKSNKSSTSCLGRCDLPKHRCLERREVKPGPVPKHMGWLYTAKNSPEHQLRCGWRPGHVSCSVLRKIEQHNSMRMGSCTPCPSSCSRPLCSKPCCMPPKCLALCPSSPSCCKQPAATQPILRIIRHEGQYTICTKPSNVNNAPSGPYPLKYVLNTDPDEGPTANAKYSVEAKFNDYHFDYTSSQSSFVLDFSPPEQRCFKPCPK